MPQDHRIGTPHHRDGLHAVLLERAAHVLYVRLAHMRHLDAGGLQGADGFPHSSRRHR
jgi:hypothetical protein